MTVDELALEAWQEAVRDSQPEWQVLAKYMRKLADEIVETCAKIVEEAAKGARLDDDANVMHLEQAAAAIRALKLTN